MFCGMSERQVHFTVSTEAVHFSVQYRYAISLWRIQFPPILIVPFCMWDWSSPHIMATEWRCASTDVQNIVQCCFLGLQVTIFNLCALIWTLEGNIATLLYLLQQKMSLVSSELSWPISLTAYPSLQTRFSDLICWLLLDATFQVGH